MRRVAIMNGPNLNLVGSRVPLEYGLRPMTVIVADAIGMAKARGLEAEYFQSNHEGALIDFVQAHSDLDGVVINPGALTVSSYGLAEAFEATGIPFVEVHLSNIYRRGGWHATSVFAPYAIGQIVGFRGDGYVLGVQALASWLESAERTITPEGQLSISTRPQPQE
jgi:3-dehydroquinate dehydratase II